MNLKRIGAVSLAATALASASLFSATAAQAAPGGVWEESFPNRESCQTGVDVYAKYVESRGGKWELKLCKQDTPDKHSRYTGSVLYSS